MLQIDKKRAVLITNYHFLSILVKLWLKTGVRKRISLILSMLCLRNRYRLYAWLTALCLMIPVLLPAQVEQLHVRQVDTLITSADIFEGDAPMKITLTLDIRRFQKEKYKGYYMPVHFSYEINDSVEVVKDMRMKARGNFRRNHCNLAPFWLNIKESDIQNVHLQDVNRIKVVTHCKGNTAYNDYVLKEYLAYKIYNILTPVSFRVRLVQMRYVDTGRKNKVTEGWAFLIEPEALMAERLGATVIKRDNLAMSLMKPADMDLAALFLYMIGNGDYSVTGRHNIKILGMPGFGTDGYTPVPYDFDYAGIVDAYYAIPDDNLGIKNVTERYYLGPCREEALFRPVIEQINQHREDIIKLVNDFEYLDLKQRKKVIYYLEEYFELAEKVDPLVYDIERTCRQVNP